jgi:hypothetical protein
MSFYACEKDPIEATSIKIKADQTDIPAKEAVVFTFEGNAEFLTFYSGNKNANYSNYPVDKGLPIDIKLKTYQYTYTKPGTYTATIVASSYGNYAKKQEMVVDSVVITVR